MKDLAQKLFYRIYEYFTVNILRKVFFFALIFLILTCFFALVYVSLMTMLLMYLAIAFCIAISLLDTIEARRYFRNSIDDLEYEYYMRQPADTRDIKLENDDLLSESERTYINRKLREFTFSIFVKATILIILVVLLSEML